MELDQWRRTLDDLATMLDDTDLFRRATIVGDELQCPLRDPDAAVHCFASIDPMTGGVFAGIATPDRWLSQSIEADLMFRGDDIEELLAEELADQQCPEHLPVEHFRDDQLRYVFRSPLPTDRLAAADLAGVIRAYAICFSDLGDLRQE